ncbi:phytase [Algibacter amylolyticus]|uniref:Phytase n=1 Tax=Algibacter amylolyticus TaxID=1608400 RepID=A0A5M7BKK9_9FLAO|nr:phytase [Algibacter amylolyticus]KAA5827821.1 phytase [Algibacter amylolyticus]MBB5267050.1 3-phytase [Algibacter amylolyticus]TSJ82066.1 phytase [Algibacter amylolyticus]
MKKLLYTFSLIALLGSCKKQLPVIKPTVITEKTPNDTDDPAIWVNPKDASKSIVFGTDKKTNGGVYAFDLDGKFIHEKSITNIQRPNNVDLEYGFKLNDSTQTDIIAFTERELQQIRVFSIPDMKPLDGGGFKVFTDATELEHNAPMGIALYKSAKTETVYAIVGRKSGPKTGYLYQYELVSDSLGVHANLVRKFGNFSGKKEIEAIAVDNENGIVYYSDEGHCIRKYYAEPSMGNEELSCFGGEYFTYDIEGIAIAKYKDKGFLIVSNQQAHSFNIFDLKTNAFIKELNLGTIETDGCDVTTAALGNKFPNGLFVSMNDEKNFFFHDLALLELD